MARTTIGKFIAILRKANGMTQKELGDKLYVSDKTVSRWENDESLPDLNLIPSIAEIFGITTDELLRGERMNFENLDTQSEEKQKAKTKKQINAITNKNARDFNNMTLVTIGLVLVGIIVATVCNFAFFNCILAGALALAFILSAAMSQICFTNTHIIQDFDEDYKEEIDEYNTKIVEKSVKMIIFCIVAALFSLPLILFPILYSGSGRYCLNAETWIPFGTAFAVIGLIISVTLYILVIRPSMIKKGILSYSEERKLQEEKHKKIILSATLKLLIVIAVIAVLFILNSALFASDVYCKKERFENEEEMGEYLEGQYDSWFYTAFGKEVEKTVDGIPNWSALKDADIVNGHYQCTHQYYPNMCLVYSLDGEFLYYFGWEILYSFDGSYNVITEEAHNAGEAVYSTVETILSVLGLVSCLVLLVDTAKKCNGNAPSVRRKG